MSAAVPGVADEIQALRRLIRRHRRRTLTQSGGFRQSRRRAVTRRYSRRRILRAVARSGSLREAARRLGCAPSTLSRNTDPRVRQVVNRFRRPPSPRWFPGDAREIATRYGAGWSLQRIANGYGCAARHIREVLREVGVECGALKSQPKPCPGRRINPSTGRREPCGVKLPAGRVKRCPECRDYARRERRIRLRLARWEARPDPGTFSLR